jgi:nucleoside-diphosphate-sugar epimerase
MTTSKAKRVLVTGGTGFTGSHLCQRLSAEGHQVRALVRDPNRCENLRRWNVDLAVGDLRDRESLDRAIEEIDLVYHIAALFRPENITEKEMWDTNFVGTQNMLDAAVNAGVQRFVHCSTVGVHGDVKTPPADENAPYAPGDYYQESKTEGEKLVRRYMAEERLPIAVYRPVGIYGPGDMRFLKLIKGVKTGRFVMVGSGEVLFQMIYIDDLVDGILLCGTRDEALGNIYILAGDEVVTLNELVQITAEVLDVRPPRLHVPLAPVYLAGWLCELTFKPFGIQPPLYRRRVDFFRKNRAFRIDKAKRELGFAPQVDLRSGLRRTADWYVRQGLM